MYSLNNFFFNTLKIFGCFTPRGRRDGKMINLYPQIMPPSRTTISQYISIILYLCDYINYNMRRGGTAGLKHVTQVYILYRYIKYPL